MQGPAGEFFNITWPGFVGALTAMAPWRFAAAINQAPLWRRTRAPPGMRFVPIATLRDEALPNVMRKAIAHGLGH